MVSHYQTLAELLVGLIEVVYRVYLELRPSLLVLVYYQGVAEMSYDKSFLGIFRSSRLIQTYLVTVWAPFYRS